MDVGGISIVTFDEAYAKAFADLNYAWIAKYYSIEDHDRAILDAPAEYIIRRGGQIFFAIHDGEAVGTVALIERDDYTFELAKMAVAPHLHGSGIGGGLLSGCIEFARDAGKSEIILESNTKQAAAIHLYRKFGFEETALDPESPYLRANIRMRLAL